MGILDEAIREHLALKRRQGLSDDELKRLEDEAFGPPARPGEPSTGADEHAALDRGEDGEPTDRTDEDELSAEQDVRTDEARGEAPTSPAPGPQAPEEAETGHAGGLFDYAQQGERAEGAGRGDREEPPTGERAEPTAREEPAIESLETVEHSIDEASGEAPSEEREYGEPESTEQPVPEPESDEYSYEQESDEYRYETETGEDDSVEAGEEDTGEESTDDVLEETPDFLRDAPEDDELWFEQGEPRDFDF